MKKIKNVGKVLTIDEQKAIKGGDVFCGNFPGPCMVNNQFGGYCSDNGYGSCECTLSGKPC